MDIRQLILGAALGAALSFSAPGRAYEPTTAANNASHEMLECAVFYSISKQGAENMKSPSGDQTAELMKQSGEAAMEYALLFAQMAGQTEEAFQARARLTTTDMMNEMNNDYVNFSILLEKYAQPCKVALEAPDKRYEYWLNKEPE